MKQILDKVYRGNKDAFYHDIEEKLLREEFKMLITANPEIVMWAGRKKEIYELLLDGINVEVVADGIGIVKACRTLLNRKIFKIPGIDIVSQLLYIADAQKYSLYVYGTRKEILIKFKEEVENKYRGISILALRDGFQNEEKSVAQEIKDLKPDIVLVALGVPKQELFIKQYLLPLEKGICIGVGGSIDSIAGTVKRAPLFYVNHNIEWLYRIVKEPKRLKRFWCNNVKFYMKYIVGKKEKNDTKQKYIK